jgi:hypothetical protein
MTYQKGGETFFTRKMKKAKEGQIIRLNEVKIFNLGSGNAKKNNKKTFQQIFQGRNVNKQGIGECSVILRFRKKTKTGNFECEMPKKYKEYFEGGLFSKHRNCYKFILHGASIKKIDNKFSNKEQVTQNILGKIKNKIGKNIYIVTFSKPGMSIGYFIIDNYLLYFTTNNKQDIQLNKELMPIIEKSNKIAKQVSIYFIRHAWSCSNLFGYFGAMTRLKMPELTPDAQLSGLGTVQAQLLGYNPYMTKIFNDAKFIGSSVLTRATQTALYAKLYSGFKEETLHIIPAINETLWQPKGMKLSNEFRTFVSRTATPIDYIHGEDALKDKLKNIGKYLGGQEVDLDLYYNFYKKLIGNHNRLKKHRNKMAIESTHDIFMKLVLPHLVENKGLENKEYGVVFGHGRYIKEIAAHCYKLTGKQYYQDIVNEGIYNTGIYKVNYVKYEGEDDWEFSNVSPFEKLFPILDTKSSKNLSKNLYNKRSEAFKKNEGINIKNYRKIINSSNYKSISNEANIRKTRLNTLISKIDKNQNNINLTNYRNLLSENLGPDTLFDNMYLNKAIMKQKSNKKGISLLYYYPKEGSGLPKIPIMLTGQKTGEDKGLLRETWKKYPNLYIGDSEGYRVNKGKYSRNNRNKMRITGKSKFDHGCLMDLKKFILKEKLTNQDIIEIEEKLTQSREQLKSELKSELKKKKILKNEINRKKKSNEQTNLKKFYSKKKNYLENSKEKATLFFRTKDVSNIEEENNRFINTVKKEQIDEYLYLVNGLIDKLKEDKDLKIMRSFITPINMSNFLFNVFLESICNDLKLKEMIKKNIKILTNVILHENYIIPDGKNQLTENKLKKRANFDICRSYVTVFSNNKEMIKEQKNIDINRIEEIIEKEINLQDLIIIANYTNQGMVPDTYDKFRHVFFYINDINNILQGVHKRFDISNYYGRGNKFYFYFVNGKLIKLITKWGLRYSFDFESNGERKINNYFGEMIIEWNNGQTNFKFEPAKDIFSKFVKHYRKALKYINSLPNDILPNEIFFEGFERPENNSHNGNLELFKLLNYTQQM